METSSLSLFLSSVPLSRTLNLLTDTETPDDTFATDLLCTHITLHDSHDI